MINTNVMNTIIDLDTSDSSTTIGAANTSSIGTDINTSNSSDTSNGNHNIFSERGEKKLLMENTLEIIDKAFPCMTTRERVLNWKISEHFSDVEEFSSNQNEVLVLII